MSCHVFPTKDLFDKLVYAVKVLYAGQRQDGHRVITSVPITQNIYILYPTDSHMGILGNRFARHAVDVLEARLARSELAYERDSIVIVMERDVSVAENTGDFRFLGVMFGYTIGCKKSCTYYAAHDDEMVSPFLAHFKDMYRLQYSVQQLKERGFYTLTLADKLVYIRNIVIVSNILYDEYMAGLRPGEALVLNDLERLYSQYLYVAHGPADNGTYTHPLSSDWKCAPMLDDLRSAKRFSFLNCPAAKGISTWMPVGRENIARLLNEEFYRLAAQIHTEVSSCPDQTGASVATLSKYELLYCATFEQFASAVMPAMELSAPREMFCYPSIFLYAEGVPVVNEESEVSISKWASVAFRMQVAATLGASAGVAFVYPRA